MNNIKIQFLDEPRADKIFPDLTIDNPRCGNEIGAMQRQISFIGRDQSIFPFFE